MDHDGIFRLPLHQRNFKAAAIHNDLYGLLGRISKCTPRPSSEDLGQIQC